MRVAESDYALALQLEQEIREALKTKGAWRAKTKNLSPQSSLLGALHFTARSRWKMAPHAAEELRNKAMSVIHELGENICLCDLSAEKVQVLNAPASSIAAFRAVVNDALRERAIDQNPITFAEDSAPIRTLYNIPGYGQGFERLMFDYLLDKGPEEFYELIIVMLDTGMTISEASSLTGEHLQTPSILFIPGRHERRLPLTKRTRAVLTSRFGSKEKLFPRLRNDYLKWHWGQMALFFGLENTRGFSSFCLRNTTAFRLFHRGVDAKIINEYMGTDAILKRIAGS